MEHWIREKRDAGTITFEDVDQYRNLVNVISNSAITPIILGPENLQGTRLESDSDYQMDIQAIVDKYQWVFDANPANEVERAIMLMHNWAMAAQITDDWQGRHIDKHLAVPTYASEALRMTDGDKKGAKTLLDKKEHEYRKKVRELGLGRIATHGSLAALESIEKANRFVTKRARHDRLLRAVLEKKHPALRERSYIEGKLDRKSTTM